MQFSKLWPKVKIPELVYQISNFFVSNSFGKQVEKREKKGKSTLAAMTTPNMPKTPRTSHLVLPAPTPASTIQTREAPSPATNEAILQQI